MLAALQLGGCGYVPSLGPMAEPPQITDVVQRVECEIFDTVLTYRKNPKTRWIVNYAAKVTLALTVSQDGSVSPDGALLGPFGAGTYAIGLGGSVKGSAERLATYAFTIDFSKVDRFRPACTDPNNMRLHGSIGFADWFDRVIASIDGDDPFTRPSDISHKLDFQLDATFRLVPAYELLRSRGSSALAANQTLKHSVDFTMTYNDPNAKDYIRVCVVNTQGPCFEPAPPAGRAAAEGGTAARRPSRLAPSVQQRLDSNTLDLQIRSLRLDQFRR